MRNIRFHIDPAVLILFLGMLLTDRSLLCLAVLLASAVHEAGHLLAAKWLRIPIRRMRLDVLGARLDAFGRMLSYGEEWIFCAAGPLFSLLFAAFPAPLWKVSVFARQLSCASFLLGMLNLLPIRTFDGGRMLLAGCSGVMREKTAERILNLTSFLFLFLLWCIAVYCLLKVGDGLSLFCFSMSLFSRFFEGTDLQ